MTLIAANDNMPPRLLTREQAAAYCGCHPSTWSRWVALCYMPPALPRIGKWDRRAIDAKLDALSGLNDIVPSDPYLAWRAEDARRA